MERVRWRAWGAGLARRGAGLGGGWGGEREARRYLMMDAVNWRRMIALVISVLRGGGGGRRGGRRGLRRRGGRRRRGGGGGESGEMQGDVAGLGSHV